MNKRQKGTLFGAGASIVGAIVLIAGITSLVIYDKPDSLIDDIIDIVTPEDEMEWHVVQVITPEMLATGENTPDDDDTGWCSTFCLDYAETPATCLASNATNGAYDGWSNVSGYVDTDDTDTDLKSEDPFYFVARCRFNDTVQSAGLFQGTRCRATLTVTGDESITTCTQTGDQTNATGGGIVSFNDSSEDFIFINFYWDDNSDGYRILDDGSLAWSLTIEAKY